MEYDVNCAVYRVLWEECAVYSVQYALCILQYLVCSRQFILSFSIQGVVCVTECEVLCGVFIEQYVRQLTMHIPVIFTA